jgi:hypothetical protein
VRYGPHQIAFVPTGEGPRADCCTGFGQAIYVPADRFFSTHMSGQPSPDARPAGRRGCSANWVPFLSRTGVMSDTNKNISARHHGSGRGVMPPKGAWRRWRPAGCVRSPRTRHACLFWPTVARSTAYPCGATSSTLRATTSQPRSLLSIARLNIARSRLRSAIWSSARIAHGQDPTQQRPRCARGDSAPTRPHVEYGRAHPTRP